MKKVVYWILGILIVILIISISIFFINHSNKELVDLEEVKTDPDFENVIYNNVEDVWDDSVLGILTIEKIGLNVTVKEGTSDEILLKYVGHIEETATYDGNIGLAGHNRGNNCAFFARLNELEKGDIIKYQTKFYTREYKVDNIQVIYETDWNLLQDTNENKLTMLTCISNKSNQRLCVQATEITSNDL